MSLFKLLFSRQLKNRFCFLFLIGIAAIVAYFFIFNCQSSQSTIIIKQVQRDLSSDKSKTKFEYDDDFQYCYYDNNLIVENISLKKLNPIRSGCRKHSREIFYTQNGFIHANVTVLELERLFLKSCSFRSIQWHTDYSYIFGKPILITKFDDISKFYLVSSDFIYINCSLESIKNQKYEKPVKFISKDSKISEISNGKFNLHKINQDIGNKFSTSENDKQYSMHEQFLVQIVEKDETIEKLNTLSKNKSHSSTNILVLIIDSLSQTSFYTDFKETFEALENPIVMHGFNILGDSGIATLLPLLTGLTDEELSDLKRDGNDGGQYVGALPFIWNRFEEQGYVTLYAEDETRSGTFQHHFMGFEEQPVDHYMRPFWLALESIKHQNMDDDIDDDDDDNDCILSQWNHRYIFEYLTSFFNNYEQSPKFALAFIKHLDQTLDRDLNDFINLLRADGVFNDTLIILIGNQGRNYGEYQSMIEGMLNERQPIAVMSVPDLLASNRPGVMEKLERNKNKLVTSFDIHATLLGLIDPSMLKERGIRGSNLFEEEIPKDRTCKSSGVSMHYCTCSKYEVVIDTEDAGIHHDVNTIVDKINKIIQDGDGFDKCHKLSLEEIVSARFVVPNEVVHSMDSSLGHERLLSNFTSNHSYRDKCFLQIVLRTSPGDALFEGTVALTGEKSPPQIHPGLEGVNPNDISRLDVYGNKAECIERMRPQIAKFCHCSGKEEGN